MLKKNPELKVGDKIILIHMDDIKPVRVGTKGTVTHVGRDPFEKNELIYSVDWENGSKLSIVSSTDLWMLEDDLTTLKNNR